MSEVTATTTDTGSSVADTGTDVTEAGAESTEAQQPTQAEVKAMKELFKYKVDGQEIEEEIDFSDKEGLRRRLQISHAAEKRMMEAKAANSKAMKLIKAFEEDPQGAIESLGEKGLEAAKALILKKIQEDMMSPEEKAARDRDLELEKYRNKEKTEKQKAEESRMKALENKYAEDYQKTIIDAFTQLDAKPTTALVREMAGLLLKSEKAGIDLSPKDLAEMLLQSKREEQKYLFKGWTGKQLAAHFGPELAKELRKYDLEGLMSKNTDMQQKGEVVTSEKSSGPKRPMSMDEWRASVDRRVSGKF